MNCSWSCWGRCYSTDPQKSLTVQNLNTDMGYWGTVFLSEDPTFLSSHLLSGKIKTSALTVQSLKSKMPLSPSLSPITVTPRQATGTRLFLDHRKWVSFPPKATHKAEKYSCQHPSAFPCNSWSWNEDVTQEPLLHSREEGMLPGEAQLEQTGLAVFMPQAVRSLTRPVTLLRAILAPLQKSKNGSPTQRLSCPIKPWPEPGDGSACL